MEIISKHLPLAWSLQHRRTERWSTLRALQFGRRRIPWPPGSCHPWAALPWRWKRPDKTIPTPPVIQRNQWCWTLTNSSLRYLGNAAVNVANGRPIWGGEAAIDATDHLINLLLKVLVLLNVRTGRDGDLDEDHLNRRKGCDVMMCGSNFSMQIALC